MILESQQYATGHLCPLYNSHSYSPPKPSRNRIQVYYSNRIIISVYDYQHVKQTPGARFTNDFLPAIQIRWKHLLAVIPLLAIRSQQFLHMSRQHSCRAMYEIW